MVRPSLHRLCSLHHTHTRETLPVARRLLGPKAPSALEWQSMQYRLRRPRKALTAACPLAACGGTPSASNSTSSGSNSRDDSDLAKAAVQTYDKYNGMSGKERTDALVACAEEEGEL